MLELIPDARGSRRQVCWWMCEANSSQLSFDNCTFGKSNQYFHLLLLLLLLRGITTHFMPCYTKTLLPLIILKRAILSEGQSMDPFFFFFSGIDYNYLLLRREHTFLNSQEQPICHSFHWKALKFSNFSLCPNHLEGLWKRDCWMPPLVSDSAGLGCDPRICIFNKALGDTDDTGPEIALWEALLYWWLCDQDTHIEFELNTKYFIGTGGPKEAHLTSKVYKSYVFSFFPQRNKQ